MKFDFKLFFLLIGFAVLVFFAQNRSFLLMFDGLTYVAIAKNILKTGEWKTLHYSAEQYINYYQHPPLAIWIQAIIFKLFGYSEPLSRIFSSTLAVLSVGLVFWFTRIFYGSTSAFWAGIVLITSSRFIKWGTNFYLDGIMGFFCFAACVLWIVSLTAAKPVPNQLKISTRASFVFATLSGFLLSCAFLTKGIIAFAPLALIGLSFLVLFKVSSLLRLLLFSLGLLAPLALWYFIFDGNQYLRQYWADSLSGRVQTTGVSFLSSPWENLLKVWLPWWPLFFLTPFMVFWKQGGQAFKNSMPFFLIFFGALMFPIGFSMGSNYYEHYLTPFYPFGAVVVGVFFSFWVKPISARGLRIGGFILLIASLFIATVAPSFHYIKPSPVSKWIIELSTLPESVKGEIKQVAFSGKACEIWYCIANVLGKTDWQAIGNFDVTREAIPGTVLITLKDEIPSKNWQEIPCMYVEGFKAYASTNSNWCR